MPGKPFIRTGARRHKPKPAVLMERTVVCGSKEITMSVISNDRGRAVKILEVCNGFKNCVVIPAEAWDNGLDEALDAAFEHLYPDSKTQP